MSRPIELGCYVTIVIYHADGGQVVIKHQKLLHVPSDTGDWFYLEDTDSTVYGMNPMCATFQRIIRED